jgi:hypothetical protein
MLYSQEYLSRAMKLETARLGRPHDAYNIYSVLERERIASTTKGSSKKAAQHQQLSFDLALYKFIVGFPDPPPQYRELQLPPGWFVQHEACEDTLR